MNMSTALTFEMHYNGAFSFVSNFWGENVSDLHIAKESGLLDLLESNDDVMADCGFNIRDLLTKISAL